MYYHSRELKYVQYGKVMPPPEDTLDPHFRIAYQWLGRRCGFYPQIWLSRSRSAITGFRGAVPGKRSRDRSVLFAFEPIKGFPVEYDLWCELLNVFANAADVEEVDREMIEQFKWRATEPGWCPGPADRTWKETKDLETVLERNLFYEHDQVVVPSLNLKAAKRIICGNERQKRLLRWMGFIEDRIEIRKIAP